MLNQNKKNILKDFLKRKYFTKKEIKKVILKSIIQNLNINKKIRSLAILKYSKFKSYGSISKQNNNICLKTGRFKGVIKGTSFSRHFVKKLGIQGDLQNYKISSW